MSHMCKYIYLTTQMVGFASIAMKKRIVNFTMQQCSYYCSIVFICRKSYYPRERGKFTVSNTFFVHCKAIHTVQMTLFQSTSPQQRALVNIRTRVYPLNKATMFKIHYLSQNPKLLLLDTRNKCRKYQNMEKLSQSFCDEFSPFTASFIRNSLHDTRAHSSK